MRKVLQSIICLTVAFVFFFTTAAFADTTLSNVSVESAPLSSSSPTLDGMVRVYLSSLGSPTSLTLTVSGSYSLSDGTSLTSGESLSVSFNSSTGAITLKRNGVSYSMGTTFTLRRHSTTGSNGIKIAEARKPSNLYPGDIQFKAVSQSSGGYKLYTIAYIYIEDYLYGVVPYEMGSSAPLEALKAQAVAARTYTVRMMNARSTWSYDVVDTTGDQTYNGTPTTTTNCNTAVNATKGIVLMNGSSYTATYYSASNGGQTESIKNAWGTTGYSYLSVKDDPFDYANPNSVVKQTTLYTDAANSSNNASLMALLKTKAVSALSSAGYNASTYNTTLQTIKAIAANTPMYASPSRLYTKLDFTLSVSTYSASNVYSTVTITVTCDIFNELESMLGMSIQSSDNELWSVVETDTGFKLQARRYGHGLGMSQRGAMYMGQLGYTYDEILGFYYNDSSRVGCTFTNTILAAGSSEVITTEEDPAETDDSTVRGKITLSSATQLAVRNAKSTTATVLTVLSNGTSVTVLSNDGTWCLVTFGSITGYVPTSSLTITGTAAETDDTVVSTIAGFAVVTADGYLNLRDDGSYSGSIIATAPADAIVTVLSWSTSWAHIQYGTIVAYASSDYLSFSATYPETIDEDEQTTGDTEGDSDTSDTLTAVVATESGSLNMRQFAQAGSTILTTIPKGATVTVTAKGTTWSAVTYLGVSGYVMTSFLSFAESSDTDTQDEDITGLQAMVVTESGSLNLRAQAKAGSSIYCTIPRLAVIDVLSKGTEWCQITYSGTTGYVMTAFLVFIEAADSSDTEGDSSDETQDEETTETVTAVVTTESGALNLRAEAVSNSQVLTRIPKGTTIVVLQKMDTWTYTCYLENYGYVMNSFLTFSSSAAETTQTTDSVSATVSTESGSLNLRDAAYGNILTTIPQGATVAVYTKGSAWCYIAYNGVYGYVMTSFLSISEANETDSADETGDTEETGDSNTADETTAETATVSVDASAANLRAARSADATALTAIPNGTTVTLLEQGTEWCKVEYGSYQGYVQTQYLIITTTTEDTSNDIIETDDPDSVNETGAVLETSITAWVNTASGSLNMRETTSSDAAIMAQVAQYTQVEVLTDMASTWCEICYDSIYGYVLSAYLTTTQPDTTAAGEESTEDSTGDTAESEEDTTTEEETLPMDATLRTISGDVTAYVRPPAGDATLGQYEACSESSELLNAMGEGSEVEVVRVGDTWCEIIYHEQLGYCLRDGLSYIAE